jgi:hypothetical protein
LQKYDLFLTLGVNGKDHETHFLYVQRKKKVLGLGIDTITTTIIFYPQVGLVNICLGLIDYDPLCEEAPLSQSYAIAVIRSPFVSPCYNVFWVKGLVRC